MAKYAIQIKKGEIQYSISSDDRDFISVCIDEFFCRVKKQTKPFDKVAEPKLLAEKQQPIEPAQAQEQTVSADEEVLNNEAQESYAEIKNDDEDRDDTINRMVKSLFEKSAEDTIIDLNNTFKQEKEINEEKSEEKGLSELTGLLEPKLSQKEELNKEDQIFSLSDEFNFNSILEDKINNPVYEEIQEQKVFNYDEFLRLKQPESLTDYLIITAYYMLENENVEQFQLKQLNAKLFNSMNMVVDRKTIQKALEDGLIYVVSDGIQNDGAVEYALTQAGQEFYKNGIA